MAKSRDPFVRALEQIRARAVSGAYASSPTIVIAEEARRLGLSTTPVREALSCLCGEGLIERGPSGGFVAPRMDAATVRDRYDFRLICLIAALDLTVGLPSYGRLPPRGGSSLLDAGSLFESVVRRTGNRALLTAFRRVDGQLRQFRDAEARIFRDVPAEAERLFQLAEEEVNGALRKALHDHHQRRSRAAALLSLEVMRRSGDGADGGRSP